MSYAAARVKEVRFVIDDEITHAYILCEAEGDCPIGVQGWHYKAYGKSKSILDILNLWKNGDDHVLWPLKSPEEIT